MAYYYMNVINLDEYFLRHVHFFILWVDIEMRNDLCNRCCKSVIDLLVIIKFLHVHCTSNVSKNCNSINTKLKCNIQRITPSLYKNTVYLGFSTSLNLQKYGKYVTLVNPK